MPVFRVLILLLLVACATSFAIYAFTGVPRWKAFGIRLLRWTIIVVIGFSAVLVLQRCASETVPAPTPSASSPG